MRLFDGVYFSSRFCSFFPNTLAPPLRFCYNQSCRPQGADECFSLPSNFTQSGSSPPRRTPIISFSEELAYEHQLRQLSRLLLRRQIPQLFAGRRGALQQPAQRDTHDRKLESELGCALFFRSPQGVRLTPEGEKLYTHIAVAFESIEAGEEEVLSDQSLQSGIVHIAASSLALRTRLLQVLARYRRAYPHVRICLTNHSASHGLAAVQNGLADFAILAEGASVPDSLTAQKIDEIQEIPICGPAFLELTEEPVSLKRLADYPIISLTEGTSSHDFYAELFLRHGLSFSPDVEVETTAQVPPVVQSDLGVGFVPREMLYGTPEASGIYPIMLEEPIPARSVFLFQRKTQPLSIAAKKLRQMLLEDAPQESGK